MLSKQINKVLASLVLILLKRRGLKFNCQLCVAIKEPSNIKMHDKLFEIVSFPSPFAFLSEEKQGSSTES